MKSCRRHAAYPQWRVSVPRQGSVCRCEVRTHSAPRARYVSRPPPGWQYGYCPDPGCSWKVYRTESMNSFISTNYSRIPLSRAPLTRENQLVALAPWTPNFSDSSLAAAHMTEPVTTCVEVSKFLHSFIHLRRHDNPLISVTAWKCTIPTCWAT